MDVRNPRGVRRLAHEYRYSTGKKTPGDHGSGTYSKCPEQYRVQCRPRGSVGSAGSFGSGLVARLCVCVRLRFVGWRWLL